MKNYANFLFIFCITSSFSLSGSVCFSRASCYHHPFSIHRWVTYNSDADSWCNEIPTIILFLGENKTIHYYVNTMRPLRLFAKSLSVFSTRSFPFPSIAISLVKWWRITGVSKREANLLFIKARVDSVKRLFSFFFPLPPIRFWSSGEINGDFWNSRCHSSYLWKSWCSSFGTARQVGKVGR